MKNEGKIFEEAIKNSIPEDVYYHRIKDPANSFGRSSMVRFSLTNEFDLFLYKKPILIALELKSKKSSSISFSTDKSIKGKDIKFTQILGLRNANNYDIVSGFLFNFRGSNNTYYLDIKDFDEFLNNTDKVSINEKDVINFGGVIVKSRLKKVKYQYDLSFLWEGQNSNES